MTEPGLSNFQVTIISSSKTTTASGDDGGFEVNRHSRRPSAIIDRIDELAGIWHQVIVKLTELADQSQIAAAASQLELNEIEFNIGVEAGLSVGLVTKGDASVTVKFAKKKVDGQSS